MRKFPLGSKLVFVGLDFIRDESSPWRRIFALGIIGAFLFTIALSEIPRLHEKIHAVQGTQHYCAVTMLSSGNVDHSAIDPIAAAPARPLQPELASEGRTELVLIALGISRLEHAPPARS